MYSNESSIQTAKVDTEDVLAKMESRQKELDEAARIRELEQLYSELEQIEKETVKEELLETFEIEQLENVAEVKQALSLLDHLSESIITKNNTCRLKKEELLRLQVLYESRQSKLLYELRTVYPIQRQDNGEFAILDIEIPFDISQKDDDYLATGLGYLVHLLSLISKYLEVKKVVHYNFADYYVLMNEGTYATQTPLRYPLIFFGSRSMVLDPVPNVPPSGPGSVTVGGVELGVALPLFRRSAERDRFDQAFQCLRIDLEQLLIVRGLEYNTKEGLLFNAEKFFYSCQVCHDIVI